MYKVIQNNEVVDALDKLHYVWRNPRNGVLLSCDARHGQGVISYNGSTIYSIGDKLPEYPAVTLEEIDADEYKRLRDLLDGVEEPPGETEAETETETQKNEPVKEPMSIAEMREKIQWLESSVDFITKLLGGKAK